MFGGKTLLLFSQRDPSAVDLSSATASLGAPMTCASLEELRGKLQGAHFDYVLVEDSAILRKLLDEADPEGRLLQTPLVEIEKRHILRVLASTSGNKTQAARVLGIDTKTLYNKLKAYGASAADYRHKNIASRRSPKGNGTMSTY